MMKASRSPYRILKSSLLLVLVLCTLSACSSVTGVDPSPLDFTAEQIRPGSQEPVPEPGATGGDGEILFQGAIGTPVPCYDVEGGLDIQGDVLTLDVIATPRDVVCIQVLATFGYRGLVTGMSPGFYEVEIAHVLGDAREVVFEGAVEVE